MTLELIFGPMFSGKSTELLRRIDRHKIGNKKCILLKHSKDDRSGTDRIGLHSSTETFEAFSFHTIARAMRELDNMKGFDVVGIDEGQFFEDIAESCLRLHDLGLTVIVAALDLTFERKPFGGIPTLACYATDVLKLNAVCLDCGEDAVYSKRIVTGGEEIEIGGKDKYKAVCTSCFNKL